MSKTTAPLYLREEHYYKTPAKGAPESKFVGNRDK